MVLAGLFMAQGISTLSQIMSAMDSSNAQFEQGMEILNRIQSQYYLPIDLYLRLKKHLRHRFDSDVQDLNQFIDDLPQNLKVEAAKFIHENTKNSIDLFRNLDEASVAWICPLLRPMMVTANSEIYHENNKVDCVYFL